MAEKPKKKPATTTSPETRSAFRKASNEAMLRALRSQYPNYAWEVVP